MIKVYCEVRDTDNGFSWRIVAECGALGRFEGNWCHHYQSLAVLRAPSATGGAMQTWIAGSSFYGSTEKTIGGFPEFTPISLGDSVGDTHVVVF